MKETIKKKLETLTKDRERIFQMIQSIPSDQLDNDSYGWSIIQVLSHLNDAETASLHYMRKKMQAGDQMNDSSIANSVRMWLTNQALKTSLKWKAPSYISQPPSYPLQEMQEKWDQTRQSIFEFVEKYPDKWLNKLVYKHPMGGRQNLSSAIDSFIYHQIHHMHQIKRIKKQLEI